MRPKPSKGGKGPDSAAWSDLARLLSGGPMTENEEANGAVRRTGSGPRHARSGVAGSDESAAVEPDVAAEPDAVAEPDLQANGVERDAPGPVTALEPETLEPPEPAEPEVAQGEAQTSETEPAHAAALEETQPLVAEPETAELQQMGAPQPSAEMEPLRPPVPLPAEMAPRPAPKRRPAAKTGHPPEERLHGPGIGLARRAMHAAVLLPVAGGIALAQTPGMGAGPMPSGSEAGLVAQAWALVHGGTIGGQPLAAAPGGDQGGLSGALVAGWAAITRAFARHAESVAAGREVALAASLLTVVLVWVLARQLGLTRWTAGAAVLLTGLSPLSVTLHREVVPGVLAAPFLVGSFVLASGTAASEGRARLRAAAAAACLTAAAFTAPLALAWVPALVWVLWLRAEPEERSSVLSGAAWGSVTLIAAWWIGGSIAHWLPGWLGPHALWQAASALPGGGLDVAQVLRLDPLVPLLGLVTVPLALAVASLRPIAVGCWLAVSWTVAVTSSEQVPVTLLALLVPFIPLLAAGVFLALWTALRPAAPPEGGVPTGWLASWGSARGMTRTHARIPLLVCLVGLLAAAALNWPAHLQPLVRAGGDHATPAAVSWLRAGVPPTQPVLADDGLWVDLARAGYTVRSLHHPWLGEGAGGAGALSPASPRPGWPVPGAGGWILSTPSLRVDLSTEEGLRDAAAHSLTAARFRTGARTVDVRQMVDVMPDTQQVQEARSERIAAGTALSENPRLGRPAAAALALRAGRVDARLMAVLALITARQTLSVSGFPAVAGEDEAGRPRRTAALTAVDDVPVTAAAAQGAVSALRSLLAQQSPEFRAQLVPSGGAILLRLPPHLS
jgi:hypothetical protein